VIARQPSKLGPHAGSDTLLVRRQICPILGVLSQKTGSGEGNQSDIDGRLLSLRYPMDVNPREMPAKRCLLHAAVKAKEDLS